MPASRPLLANRYGAKCYQKNSDHRRRFAHPGDSDFSEGGGPSAAAGKRSRKPVSYAAADEDNEDSDSGGDSSATAMSDDEEEDGGKVAPAVASKRRADDVHAGVGDKEDAPAAKRVAMTAEEMGDGDKVDGSATEPAALGLVDLFTGMTFYVSKESADYHKLHRLAVAFDGDVTCTDVGHPLACILVGSLDPKSWADDVKAVVAKHPGKEGLAWKG